MKREVYLNKVRRLQMGGEAPVVPPKSSLGNFIDRAYEGVTGFIGDAVDAFSEKDNYEQNLVKQQVKSSSAQAYQTIKQDFTVLATHLYEQGDEAAIELLSRVWDKVSSISEAAIAFQKGGKVPDKPKTYDGAYVGVVGNKPYYFDKDKIPVRPINLEAKEFPKSIKPISEYTQLLDGEPSQCS